MKLFAVETNLGRLKAQFVNETEQEILSIYKHIYYFYQSAFPVCFFYLMFLTGIGAMAVSGILPEAILFAAAAGTLVAGFLLLSAYANWRYDFILFTTDKMVIFDCALFRQSIEPVNLEHLSSVTGETKFGNLFGFGTLHFMLKDEHTRPELVADYIPDIAVTSARISDIITDFQRRKMRVGAPILQESADMEEAAKVYGLAQNVKVQQETGQDNPGSTQAPPGQQPQQQPKPLKEQQPEEQAPAEQQPPPQELQQKVPQLEAQVQELQEQVNQLKKPQAQLGGNQ
jgi:hypothetical protein